MSLNPFANLGNDLEQQGDRLGGGGPLDTDAYPATIKLAFIGESSGGARSVTIHADAGGREFRETLYVTSGREKGQKEYYERDGKKIPLPGYATVNDLCLLATGYPLSEQTFEEKVVNLYDFDERKELPTKVTAITSVMGKKVILGIQKITDDKSKKNESTGAYEPTGETRDLNAIDKVFHVESKKTVSELIAKADAQFHDKWVAKNRGVTVMKAKGASGTSGIPGQGGGTPPAAGGAAKGGSKSLFG